MMQYLSAVFFGMFMSSFGMFCAWAGRRALREDLLLHDRTAETDMHQAEARLRKRAARLRDRAEKSEPRSTNW